ncbi:NAD(P)-dependent oxidoreductase [Labedella endophytica]|uniref:NAD(P)-dependent oxidoreductase n=1 Tax=Labedella endophytica TaxID=1523160 RepID=A0A433JRE7_9MICO|nr:NAD(P)-dependent oxidoreductase [Labedella endophytica]RUR00928.1 NAD(P)-dependent oxidoreductase [Labedella endophytica]
MATIGFVGLGVMGRPMVANLAAAGHTVNGFSRGEASRSAARDAGLSVVDSVAEAVAHADLVITMLPDSPDVEEVALGDDGILTHIPDGADYIDASTIRPEVARKIASAFVSAGHGALDAPVSGGEAGAREGALSIMVGGDPETLERWRSVLDAVGASVVHVGPSGAGQVVKAANQLVVALHLQALAEAVVFLEAQSVDVETALSVIRKGLGGSTVLERKSDSVLAGDFRPGFRAELHAKDLAIVEASARTGGVGLPATGLVSQLMRSVIARGSGASDHSALVELARVLNGRVDA